METESIKRLVNLNNKDNNSLYIKHRDFIMKVEITDENYDEIKAAMKKFLIKSIEKRIGTGTKYKLSLELGRAESHVDMIMKRGAFSALERLYKEIKEKEGREMKTYQIITIYGDDGAEEVVSARDFGKPDLNKSEWVEVLKTKFSGNVTIVFGDEEIPVEEIPYTKL